MFFMGATNLPWEIDTAITRPGRLDYLLYVPIPDYEDRLAIFNVYAKKHPLAADVNTKVLAMATEGYTGSDIRNLFA